MLLFKLLQQLLMPSNVILIILLITLFVLIKKKYHEATKILLIISIICYYIFSITLTSNIISTPLTEKYNSDFENLNPEIRTIVLLTGSITDRASQVLKLYDQLDSLEPGNVVPIQIIISGTSAIDPADYEQATKTKQFLTERGIPQTSIILEINSRNTFESAIKTQQLVGQKPIYLVTSDYHMARSMFIFQREGMDPIASPADIKPKINYNIFDFFPNPDNLEKTDLSIHEYLGILYYKLSNNKTIQRR